MDDVFRSINKLVLIAMVFYSKACHPSYWFDEVAMTIGKETDSRVEMQQYSLDFKWNKNEPLHYSDTYSIDYATELNLLYLDSTIGSDQARSKSGSDHAYGLALVPILSVHSSNTVLGVTPYTEIGLGAGWLSTDTLEKKTNSAIDLGSNVQFRILAGAGFKFGIDNRFTLRYRFIHHSNGNLASINEALNFHTLGFSYRY
ncbi:hypothetical protein OAG1_28390 [Agarivorans sp. OAG1]|uniref:acyloxyacyl hydrolase n=1 Tax=Agarivorans sp. OAG1 TaxID=3082387 RepID=UPI002B2D2B96|nr:hypothetical protein OAG1_28390 [Agarivorans sp. OAG1]